MKSFFQFLTTPTSDTRGTSIFVDFNGKRYFFGSLSEGTQRATIEQGARIFKVTELFITGRTEWSNLGGLLGLILTLADNVAHAATANAETLWAKTLGKRMESDLAEDELAKMRQEYNQQLRQKPFLAIFGPNNLNYMLATARRFIFRTSMPLVVNEVRDLSDSKTPDQAGPAAFAFQDTNIKVWALSVPPQGETNGEHQHRGTSPRNERKRSHEEMDGVTSPPATNNSSVESSHDMSKRVVADMFSSDWRADRLYDTALADVKLPAKLWQKDPVTKKTRLYNGPMPGDEGYNPNTRVLVRSPWPAVALTQRLEKPAETKESVSYIVKTYPRRGKFNPDKALALGLHDRRRWSALAQGNNLTNDNGEVITPDMVLDPTLDATGFVVADLPSSAYVETFLQQYREVHDDLTTGIASFVWILGEGVAQNPALHEFITSRSDAKHIVTSPELCEDRLSFEGVARTALRLSTMDQSRYQKPRVHPFNAEAKPALPAGVLVADRGLVLHLEPKTNVSTAEINPKFDPTPILEDVPKAAHQASAKARADVEDDRESLSAWAQKIPSPNTEVITLGTGSAQPSKHRNVSGTLVRVPGWGSILFDCGEGTIGQLRRLYSEDELNEIWSDLRAIWISHLHADHHLGTASIIKAWYAAMHSAIPASPHVSPNGSASARPSLPDRSRLAVISDEAMIHWLWEYAQLEDIGYSRLAPICVRATEPVSALNTSLHWFAPPKTAYVPSVTAPRRSPSPSGLPSISPSDLGLQDLQAVRVLHCNGALACSFTLPDGFKVSYSGDCRPSTAFARIGEDSTLLIHEATFDDELIRDAQAKRHSTTGEALKIGEMMRAKAVVLTHFSQRYAKVPVIERGGEAVEVIGDDEVEDEANDGMEIEIEEDEGSERVQTEDMATKVRIGQGVDLKWCLAFDYMRVKVGDIAAMEKYVPALVALFEPEEKQRGALKTKKKEKEKLLRATGVRPA